MEARMLRILVLLLLLCGPVYSQVYLGLHGAGSWSKLNEIAGQDVSDQYDDYEDVFGFGGDLSIRATGSPFGIEAGFTYLNKASTDLDVDAEWDAHPIYISGVFFLSNMLYLSAGVNYTLWDMKLEDESLDNLDGKLGYQFGLGVELGAGKFRLYGVGYYMIQKGEVTQAEDLPTAFGVQLESAPEVIDFESRSFLIRAGIRIQI
jgi:hypothetical protein